MPIATITDAYSAYAIYPQAKPLIEQSTLVKVEGRITIHSKPESKTEGFVFVMPEAHPAVSGFEMMLRWLFPVYDTFNLYGRPRSLIADTLDTRGLMFAMPRQRRYGYLEIIDIATLIHTDGSKDWSEREWRKQLKEFTSRRMEMMKVAPSRDGSQLGSSRGPRNSLPSRPANLRFDDNASVRSSPSINHHQNGSAEAVFVTPQKSSTAPANGPFPPPTHNYHARAVSESIALASPISNRRQKEPYISSRLSIDREAVELQDAQAPPVYQLPSRNGRPSLEVQHGRNSSESDPRAPAAPRPEDVHSDQKPNAPPTPVAEPPAFIHQQGDAPPKRPTAPYDMRRQNSRMSTATLSQMVDATGMRPYNGINGTSGEVAAAGAAAAWKVRAGGRGEDQGAQGVIGTLKRDDVMTANRGIVPEGVVASMPLDERAAASRQTRNEFLEPPLTQTRSSSEKSVTRKPLLIQGSANSEAPPEGNQADSQNPFADPVVPALAHDDVTAAPDHQIEQGDFENHDSTETPEYAIMRRSTDNETSENSVPQRRSGILKTVGNPDLTEGDQPSEDVPIVDFGPTQSLKPLQGSRSTTPKPLQDSRGRDLQPQDRPASKSLTSEQRLSSYQRGSPIEGSGSRPSPQSRSSSFENRQVAWQPGSSIGAGRRSPGAILTPEQFVQQRASLARAPPRYVPQRSRSSGYFPVESPISAEWSKSPTPPRANSRAQSPTATAQQDYGSHLSAREQMHVAQMTGSPLINMPRKIEPSAAPIGLVGAIQAREQERKMIREGVSGHMVQHAIAMRSQQAQSQAQEQMQAQQAAYLAYGYSQQAPTAYNRRSVSYPANMTMSQQQIDENSQWAAPQSRAYAGSMYPQQNPYAGVVYQQQESRMGFEHQKSFSGYYAPPNQR